VSEQTAQPDAGHAAREDTRERLSRVEIMRVLEHYDTGEVRGVREFLAGSSSSPKAVIECDRGKLLLKRRAPGLDRASMVAFAHEVVIDLLARGVCVPPLIGTGAEHNSMCQIADRTYELFVFIDGSAYARTAAQARSSGALLAEMHAAMDAIEPTFPPVMEPAALDLDRAARISLAQGAKSDTERIMGYAAESHDLNARPRGIVHGDWHPGNMIYDEGEIIAACDFDNTRVGSRDRELAQALVYFSARRAGDPDRLAPDTDLLSAFWTGYTAPTDQTGAQAPSARLAAALMPAVVLDEALAVVNAGGADPALARLALDKALHLDAHIGEVEAALSA